VPYGAVRKLAIPSVSGPIGALPTQSRKLAMNALRQSEKTNEAHRYLPNGSGSPEAVKEPALSRVTAEHVCLSQPPAFAPRTAQPEAGNC
jgi:hypothetical protein